MKRIPFFALLLFSFLLPGVALAQCASYDLARRTVVSDSGVSAGGGYDLTGTSGQPAAALVRSGFWGQAPAEATLVYLPYIVHSCETPDCGLPPNPADVAPPLDPTVATDINTATAFLYTGENPIQTGVAPGTIEFTRTAVLRGTVISREGLPLPGVTIAILDHPELGQTRSRADGVFDMVVNGGGVLTLTYEKEGYLPTQRQLDTPWQDYLWAPDVALIPVDSQVTTIDLTQPAIQVAQGSVVTDEDGTRQATLLFPPGVRAAMVLTEGGATAQQALSTLHVRATEYTVGENGPQTMPAELPPNVGYTYAVEFSADEALAAGAQDVVFDQPVISYVDNFLSFPAGTTVPVGYYDEEKAAWVPSESGVVLKIVAISGGLAELDVTGDDLADPPAALAAWGITDAERGRLAEIYPAGKSLWRYPVQHFSSWDANWGTRCKDDICDFPDVPDPEPELADDTCESTESSTIACQNQTLGEDVAVTGTPFQLHYESGRTPGYAPARSLDINLFGDPLPQNIQAVELVVSVAGVDFSRRFTPTPNLRYTFIWDGKDAYGRRVQGGVPYLVRIGYVYEMEYVPTGRFGYNGSGNIGAGRSEIVLWKRLPGYFQTWDANREGLGGWTLDVHHAYDPETHVLHQGDGTRRSAVNLVVNTIAGNGGGSTQCDNIPATQSGLNGLNDVEMAPDGSYYVSLATEICRVGTDGIIRKVVAGPDLHQYPQGLAVAPDGSLYFGDPYGYRVRRLGTDGTITTVAGNGSYLFSGDGGPATQAGLDVNDIALGSDGSLYIADASNDRIRRVGTDGIISTFAGNGTSGFSGDGGPATQAKLANPQYVAVAPNGSVYLSDYWNARIRQVGTDGTITTTAGIGGWFGWGFSGDGGPATQARIGNVTGLDVGPDGSVYLGEVNNERVRRISPDGIINTVAGTGVRTFNGDGRPANQANLDPHGVAVAPDGNLLVADGWNHRVRRVASPLPGFTLSEIAIPSEDGSELYQFDFWGRHLRTLNTLTGAPLYEFGYDGQGRLVTVTDGDGNVTTVERNADGDPTAIVAPFGQRTALTLDANDYFAGIANPAGETSRFTYTPDGLLTSRSDPRGNTYSYTYDDMGRLVKAEDPAGGSKTLARQELPRDQTRGGGWEVSLTTALGRTTRYRVETLNKGETRLTNTFPDGLSNTVVTGLDGSTIITYTDGMVMRMATGPDPRWGMLAPVTNRAVIETPGGLVSTLISTHTVTLADPGNPLGLATLTEETSLNGRRYVSLYDGASRVFTDTTPAGRRAFVSIDSQGRPVSEQVAGLDPLRYTYDARGRLSSIVNGSGATSRTTTPSYNADGYLSSIVDPSGRAVSFVYDLAGRVTYQTLPASRVISSTYDANGNLASIAPPGRLPHGFTYTGVNLTGAYIPPDVAGVSNTQTGYTYNFDRYLTRITRPDAQVIDLNYDTVGRLTGLMTPHHQTTYSYDAATGNLTTIANSRGVNLSHAYDGALITHTAWTGDITGAVNRAYDDDFRTAALTVAGSSSVAFQYDADSLLTGAGDLVLSRNAENGLLTGTALGSVRDTWGYNAFGEPITYSAAHGGTSLFSVQYARDKLGRITQKTETIGGVTDVYGYIYDLAGRLRCVQKNGVTVATYTYDSNGNRLSYTGPGGAINGRYDAQDRLLQYGNTTYAYTANGELLSKTTGGQTTNYQYDTLGNLLAVTLPDSTQIDYVIDGAGRRVGKKVDGVLVQGFLYQDALRPVAELDGAGKVVSRFVYGTRSNVPEYMVKGGHAYRFILDHLASPRLVVEVTTGQVVQRMDYDEFGNVVNDTNPDFEPFGFAGGLYDRDTEVVRFGARDYDPTIGRWTVKDPILFFGGDSNLYGYVLEDPINATDIVGLDKKAICDDCSTWPYPQICRNANKCDQKKPGDGSPKPKPSPSPKQSCTPKKTPPKKTPNNPPPQPTKPQTGDNPPKGNDPPPPECDRLKCCTGFTFLCDEEKPPQRCWSSGQKLGFLGCQGCTCE